MTEDSQTFYYYMRAQHLFFVFFPLHLYCIMCSFLFEQNASETMIKVLSIVYRVESGILLRTYLLENVHIWKWL